MAGTNSRCPFYRGVRLTEVSVKRESTVSKTSRDGGGELENLSPTAISH